MEQQYKYMVCTRCLTYNHAPYIVDAMNGFVMQETTFPVVTVIVDDASTDGEPEVIRQYIFEHFQAPFRTEETEYAYIICAKHKINPNCQFVVLLLKYNHYSIRKSKRPYQTEWVDNAKYRALCEGDDYWIHPQKLQMQVDFLESNPEYGLCYTDVGVKNQLTGALKFLHDYDYSPVISFEQLLKKNSIGTLSVVYRNDLHKQYLDDIKPATHNWKLGDYPIWLWFSKESKIRRFDLVTSMYRIAQGSASHSSDKKTQVDFVKSIMDIKFFFMDYYKMQREEREVIIKNIANGISKTALLKKNRMMYEYVISLKKESNICITLFDKICGVLLSHNWGQNLISLYLRTRIDYF